MLYYRKFYIMRALHVLFRRFLDHCIVCTHIGLVQFLLPKLDTEERREFVILWELLFYAWLLQNTASEKSTQFYHIKIAFSDTIWHIFFNIQGIYKIPTIHILMFIYMFLSLLRVPWSHFQWTINLEWNVVDSYCRSLQKNF